MKQRKSELMIGRIQVWRYERGFGFLRTAEDGDFFCHIRHLEEAGITAPVVGMWLEFDTTVNPRNQKIEAHNIRRLDEIEAEKELAWASQGAEALAWDKSIEEQT
jgi:cold shock CspA family protein